MGRRGYTPEFRLKVPEVEQVWLARYTIAVNIMTAAAAGVRGRSTGGHTPAGPAYSVDTSDNAPGFVTCIARCPLGTIE